MFNFISRDLSVSSIYYDPWHPFVQNAPTDTASTHTCTHMCTHARTHAHTHTHTHTQPFYGCLDLVWANPGELVKEETFTHSHLPQSSIVPYLLYSSNTIHGILPVHFTCLTVFFPQSLSKSFTSSKNTKAVTFNTELYS